MDRERERERERERKREREKKRVIGKDRPMADTMAYILSRLPFISVSC